MGAVLPLPAAWRPVRDEIETRSAAADCDTRAMRARSVLGVLLLAVALGAPSRSIAAPPGSFFPLAAMPGTNTPLLGITNTSRATDGNFDAAGGRTVSDDGRYVVFFSLADGMDPSPADDIGVHLYRRDLQTNTTLLVDRGPGADGPISSVPTSPSISGDGDRVAFVTQSALVPQDTNGGSDVYVREISTQTTRLASVTSAEVVATAASGVAELTQDGECVVFSTVAQLAAADSDAVTDVYSRDLDGGTTTMMSLTDGDANSAGAARAPSAGGGCGTAAFVADAPLAAGEAEDSDVDVYRRVGSSTLLESRETTAGGANLVGNASAPSLGSNSATPGEVAVAFVHGGAVKVRIGATTTVTASRQDGEAGAEFTALNGEPTVGVNALTSPDSLFVTFLSEADPANPGAELVERRILTGADQTRIVSRRDGVSGAPLTAETTGAARSSVRAVVFGTQNGAAAPDADPEHLAVYRRLVDTGTTSIASRPTGTAPFRGGAEDTGLDDAQLGQVFSADGRYVLFGSEADDLLPGGLTSLDSQLFRRDLLTGEVVLVSQTTGPGGTVVLAGQDVDEAVTISADGTRVAFRGGGTTFADTVAGIPVADDDQVFVRDIAAGTTLIASRVDGPNGAPTATGATGDFSGMSADGRHVLFLSAAPGLASGQSEPGTHLFSRDLVTGSTRLVSRRGGPGDPSLSEDSQEGASSADGRLVVFSTDDDLLDGDPDADPRQIVVRDLVAGTLEVVSRQDGPSGAFGNANSDDPTISADGSRVAFMTDAQNLGDDANAQDSVYVRDRVTHDTALMSRGEGPAGAPDLLDADDAFLSADGTTVGFVTQTALLPADTDAADDAYVRDLGSGALTLVSVRADGGQLTRPVDYALLDARADCALFVSDEAGLVPGAPSGNDFDLAYVRVLRGECPRIPPVPPVAPPGGGPGVTPPVVAPVVDRTAPRLTRVSVTNRRFRIGAKRTATSAQARARAKVGTTFRFTLSEAATVTIALERARPGRRRGSRCVASTPALVKARAKRCDRFVSAGTLTRRRVPAGAKRVAFSGRVGAKKLPLGRYRASLRATDAAANRSAVVRTTFTVVRR